MFIFLPTLLVAMHRRYVDAQISKTYCMKSKLHWLPPKTVSFDGKWFCFISEGSSLCNSVNSTDRQIPKEDLFPDFGESFGPLKSFNVVQSVSGLDIHYVYEKQSFSLQAEPIFRCSDELQLRPEVESDMSMEETELDHGLTLYSRGDSICLRQGHDQFCRRSKTAAGGYEVDKEWLIRARVLDDAGAKFRNWTFFRVGSTGWKLCSSVCRGDQSFLECNDSTQRQLDQPDACAS